MVTLMSREAKRLIFDSVLCTGIVIMMLIISCASALAQPFRHPPRPERVENINRHVRVWFQHLDEHDGVDYFRREVCPNSTERFWVRMLLPSPTTNPGSETVTFRWLAVPEDLVSGRNRVVDMTFSLEQAEHLETAFSIDGDEPRNLRQRIGRGLTEVCE